MSRQVEAVAAKEMDHVRWHLVAVVAVVGNENLCQPDSGD